MSSSSDNYLEGAPLTARRRPFIGQADAVVCPTCHIDAQENFAYHLLLSLGACLLVGVVIVALCTRSAGLCPSGHSRSRDPNAIVGQRVP